MRKRRNGYEVSFGPEIRALEDALELLRDSLIDRYIAEQGSLKPDMLDDMHGKYATCISMLYGIAGSAHGKHGLTPREESEWSAERLNAAAMLEYGDYRKVAAYVAGRAREPRIVAV